MRNNAYMYGTDGTDIHGFVNTSHISYFDGLMTKSGVL